MRTSMAQALIDALEVAERTGKTVTVTVAETPPDCEHCGEPCIIGEEGDWVCMGEKCFLAVRGLEVHRLTQQE